MCEGAPLPPPESAAACALMSVCCCARRRSVLAMSFVSAPAPGGSGYLELALCTRVCGSCVSREAAGSADALRVRCVHASFGEIMWDVREQNSGACES